MLQSGLVNPYIGLAFSLWVLQFGSQHAHPIRCLSGLQMFEVHGRITETVYKCHASLNNGSEQPSGCGAHMYKGIKRWFWVLITSTHCSVDSWSSRRTQTHKDKEHMSSLASGGVKYNFRKETKRGVVFGDEEEWQLEKDTGEE